MTGFSADARALVGRRDDPGIARDASVSREGLARGEGQGQGCGDPCPDFLAEWAELQIPRELALTAEKTSGPAPVGLAGNGADGGFMPPSRYPERLISPVTFHPLAPARGIAWALVFSIPIWALALIGALAFLKHR